MNRSRGLTLVELAVCLSVVALFAGIVVPAFSRMRDQSREALCASQLHALHGALVTYSTTHAQLLPPFMFSDPMSPSVPTSGHWGGADQAADPAARFRSGASCVNLQALVRENMISPSALLCPSADPMLPARKASYFTYSQQYSTYCLRFPPSHELFDQARSLENFNGSLLGIYLRAAGGQKMNFGPQWQIVPQVRMDQAYTIALVSQTYEFHAATDALLADEFWQEDLSAEAPAATPPLTGYPVRQGLCHFRKFNVLWGDGGVQGAEDDGTVAANSLAPGRTLADDGACNATYAENVWRFFDTHRR